MDTQTTLCPVTQGAHNKYLVAKQSLFATTAMMPSRMVNRNSSAQMCSNDDMPSDCNSDQLYMSEPYPEHATHSSPGLYAIQHKGTGQEKLTPMKVQSLLKDVAKVFGIQAPAPQLTPFMPRK